MIGCDECEEWFHGKCVNLKKKEGSKIDKYYCPSCRKDKNLEITYKIGQGPVEKKSAVEEKPATVKSEKPEKPAKPEPAILAPIPRISSPVPVLSTAPQKPTPTKSPKKPAAGKKGRGQKGKARGPAVTQCANPECVQAASSNISKYCSRECGLDFNKKRYDLFYKPKWKILSENHSKARLDKMKNLENLEQEMADTTERYRNLAKQQLEAEDEVKKFKERAQELARERTKKRKEAEAQKSDNEKSSKNDNSSKNDSSKNDSSKNDALTGDSAKPGCVICSMPQSEAQLLKHLTTCHKKFEQEYQLTGKEEMRYDNPDDPKLFCDVMDKKGTGFCKHPATTCPHHTNWASNKDKEEVCGCPMYVAFNNKIALELPKDDPEADDLCLELKKDCAKHHHWDRYRIAEINHERIRLYLKLDSMADKLNKLRMYLSNTYGGVVGVMLHDFKDHQEAKTKEVDAYENEDVAVDP